MKPMLIAVVALVAGCWLASNMLSTYAMAWVSLVMLLMVSCVGFVGLWGFVLAKDPEHDLGDEEDADILRLINKADRNAK